MKNLLFAILFIGLAIVVGILVWNLFGALVTQNPALSQAGQALGLPSTNSFGPMLDTEAQIDAALGRASTPPIVSEAALTPYSPYAGAVSIIKSTEGIDPLYESPIEYLTLQHAFTATTSVAISGWSLASLVSENTAVIPDGTSVFFFDEDPTYEPVTLAPGQQAIIATNQSPFGISFQENACIGHLRAFSTFRPSLSNECVDPSLLVPPTIENIKTYGESCIDFVQQLPRCAYVTTRTEGITTVADNCRELLETSLTYSACVRALGTQPDFTADRAWRVYLGGTKRLWRDRYEAIILRDAQGRTVDVYTY